MNEEGEGGGGEYVRCRLGCKYAHMKLRDGGGYTTYSLLLRGMGRGHLHNGRWTWTHR